MTIGLLALVVGIGLVGPLLAGARRLSVPMAIGELLAGVAFGRTGFHLVNSADSTFALMANIGFALIMFVAGSHVPLRDPMLRTALWQGAGRAALVGLLAAVLGWFVAAGFGTGHWLIYAVLIGSSSAALVLPLLDQVHADPATAIQLLPQVAIADAACIVALPLVIQPEHAARAAAGAVAVIACSGAIYLLLSWIERTGLRRRAHHLSGLRGMALELRVSLLLLLGLSALAQQVRVSVLVAGFSFGLVVAAIGEPKRLARQLFAVTEGIFGPLFFVWLGASLNLTELGHRPSFIGLGVALGVAAVAAHVAMALTGQPLPVAALASAQLGVPVAASALGTQLGVLLAGESAALLLGALLTVAVAAVSSRLLGGS
jgi:Kef-type K+ transport system membrane component KefB